MKMRLLILLAVFVLAIMSGIGLASAQDSTMLKAMVIDGATLYAEPSDTAEVVAELGDGAVVDVLATDQTGAFLQVSGDAGEGYVMLDSVIVLNLPLLAPKVYVMDEAGTGMTVGDGEVVDLPYGTVAAVLGTNGDLAYIETEAGRGWSPLAAWGDAAEMAQSVSTDMSAGGVAAYDAPKLNAEPIAVLMPGSMVYTVMAEEDGTYSMVYVPGFGMAYVQSKNLGDPVAMTVYYVEVSTDNAAGGVALYDAPKLNADPVVVVDPGTVVAWVEDVDGTYSKVYTPAFGEVYVQSKNLSNPFIVATVQEADAVLRAGPNDNIYDAVALLPAGTQVIVKGKTDNGAWVEVAIPFSEVDWGYNGVSGWLRDFLFNDALGGTDLATEMLAVTGASE